MTTTQPDSPPRPGRPPTEYRITAHARAGDVGAAEAGTTSIDIDTTWGVAPTGRGRVRGLPAEELGPLP